MFEKFAVALCSGAPALVGDKIWAMSIVTAEIERPPSLTPLLSAQRNATRWWVRWTVRLLVWSAVAMASLVGCAINYVARQSPADLEHHFSSKWVVFEALPPELQSLFPGDRLGNLQMLRRADFSPYSQVRAIALSENLAWFVPTATRRAMHLNLSDLASLDDPYRATLEEVAGSGLAGWWLVRERMRDEVDQGQFSPLRREQLERHLEQIREVKGYP